MTIDKMARYLRSLGYVVIPRERRIVVGSDFILPPRAEQSRIGKERLLDMAQRHNERAFAHRLYQDGLVTTTLDQISDPVTGSEEVMRSYICLIKPKADGED